MGSTKFNYDVLSGNIKAVNGLYKDYASNTDTANKQISQMINNGLTSAINSPVIGQWFASTWEANTTNAEEFQKSFNEWSQAVYNAMTENQMSEEQIKEAYLPELLFNGYYVNKSAYTGTSADLMIRADVVYKLLQEESRKTPDDRCVNTIKVEHLLRTYPEAKNYLYDQARSNMNTRYAAAQHHGDYPTIEGPNGKKIVQIPLGTVKNPIEREMISYHNKHGEWPTVDQVSTLTVDGLQKARRIHETKNNKYETLVD